MTPDWIVYAAIVGAIVLVLAVTRWVHHISQSHANEKKQRWEVRLETSYHPEADDLHKYQCDWILYDILHLGKPDGRAIASGHVADWSIDTAESEATRDARKETDKILRGEAGTTVRRVKL